LQAAHSTIRVATHKAQRNAARAGIWASSAAIAATRLPPQTAAVDYCRHWCFLGARTRRKAVARRDRLECNHSSRVSQTQSNAQRILRQTVKITLSAVRPQERRRPNATFSEISNKFYRRSQPLLTYTTY
jgi:hypothetical protein